MEISSKSLQEAGIKLSAFNLNKYVPELDDSIPVECIYQGGKTFTDGGPYIDLYHASLQNTKRDPRLKSSGTLTNFFFDGKKMPLNLKTAFYNWLYINALLENPSLATEVLKYDAFTDIEFNPQKSSNCQAIAAALFVSLSKRAKQKNAVILIAFIKSFKSKILEHNFSK